MKSFKEFFVEMAFHMSGEYNPLNDDHQNKKQYDAAKDWKVDDSFHKKHSLPDHIKVHKLSNPGVRTKITTIDHNTKKVVHMTTLSHHFDHEANEDRAVKEPHVSQTDVVRKSGSGLPKGHAKNVFLHHLDTTEVPHVASDTQYHSGHKMWRDLSHHALKNGLHLHHFDGNHVHKTTEKNIESHLDNSYGEDHDTHTMIISKHPLLQKVK